MKSSNKRPGGCAMQRVVHKRRQTSPPRRDITLRKAVQLAGLGGIMTEVEVLPCVWVRATAWYRGTLYAIDPDTRVSKLSKPVRERKVRELRAAGIEYVMVRVTSPEETAHNLLKTILRARRSR